MPWEISPNARLRVSIPLLIVPRMLQLGPWTVFSIRHQGWRIHQWKLCGHTVPYNPTSKKNWSWTPNHFFHFIDDKNLLINPARRLQNQPLGLFQIMPNLAQGRATGEHSEREIKANVANTPFGRRLQFANRFESLSDTDECQSSSSAFNSLNTRVHLPKNLSSQKSPSKMSTFSEGSLEKTKPPSKKKRKLNARTVLLSSDGDSWSLEEHTQHVMQFWGQSKVFPVCDQLPFSNSGSTTENYRYKTTIPLQTIPTDDKITSYCVINNDQNLTIIKTFDRPL